LLGGESRDAFMARTVPGWRAAQLVNAQPPGGRVMALDFPAPFCFDRPWIAEGLAVEPPLRVWIESSRSAADVLDHLRREDVRYLVVTPGYGGGTPQSLLPLADSRQSMQRVLGLRAALRLVGTADGVDVFAVPPAAASTTGAAAPTRP
ncbi:MAG TPA: hypothetical protein VLW17_01655, partial [Thermoanaerobaculaceae bacterium]|nr:hypothetical protein [Thermoanaerobaculaceae bacterium]